MGSFIRSLTSERAVLGSSRSMFIAGLFILALLGGSAASWAGNAERSASPAPTDRGETHEDAVRKAIPQVYRLLVEVDRAAKGGTAFLVSGKRVVATNHHVVEGGTAFSVGFISPDGIVKRIPLRLLAIFPQKDLALLEALDDLPGEPLTLTDDYPGVAAELFAIGFPAAADPQGGPSWSHDDDTTYFIPSVVTGYVSRVLTNPWFSSQLQHQTPIIPGYSGGPLIDTQGVVLAISTAIHKEANGISYGVLAADLAAFLDACALPNKKALIASRPESEAPSNSVDDPTPELVKEKAMPNPADLDMLARGQDFLDRGDIIAARLIFQYLVDRVDMPDAYAGLAKTYDPMFLNEKKVIGVSGDFAKAFAFYQQAARLGRPSVYSGTNAPTSLSGSGCKNSICTLVNGSNGPVIACSNIADRSPKTSSSNR